MQLARSPLWHTPTPDEVHAIHTIPDPIVRNLRITLAYHDLTHALTRLLGDRNLSWCSFGCWASKTAGTFIRKDALPIFMKNLLEETVPILFSSKLTAVFRPFRGESHFGREILERTLRNALEGVSDEIAKGNQMVFEEIGLAFAELVAAADGRQTLDLARCDRLLGNLKEGTPESGGQTLLRQGLEAFIEASYEQDPKRKAELMLLGNLRMGYQEQRRVQRHVAASLFVPIDEVLLVELERAFRAVTPDAIEDPILDVVSRFLKPSTNAVRQVWCRFATRWMMRLTLPDIALDLGVDIPPLSSRASFPKPLRNVEHPDLVHLIEDIDRSPDTLTGSAANDWGNLRDRMNYIADLFRSRQQDASLLRAPFTQAQIEAIRNNTVPPGEL